MRETIVLPLLKIIAVVVVVGGCGGAPTGSYKHATWVRPNDISWLESADFVTLCYLEQTGKRVKPQLYTGVTVRRSQERRYEGSVTNSATVYARNAHDVRWGLAYHIARVGFGAEDPTVFLQEHGLCFGACEPYHRFEFEARCNY